MKFQTSLRNVILDAIESTIGSSPSLEIRTGAAPAATTDADSGTLLVSISLPSNWMSPASGGIASKTGAWASPAVASGAPGHWRLKDSGDVVRAQGTAGVGAGELSLDATVTLGASVSISAFTLIDGNG